LHQVAACVLMGIAMWGGKAWAHGPARGMYYGVFAPLVFTTAGIIFREFNRRMYFAEMRFREAFWTDAATVLLQIAGVEWLYLHGKLDVPNTLWMLAGGAIAVGLWWVVRDGPRLALRSAAAAHDLALNFKLGRWFLGSNMVFTVSSQMNPWVIGALLGGGGVASYAVCESVVNIPRVALTSMQNVMAPMMARAYNDGGKPELKKMVARLYKILLLGSGVFAAGIVLFGPWIAGLIFSRRRFPADNGRTVLVLLALNLVVFAATLAQTYGLTAIKQAGYTFYANAAGLVVQAVVCVWMVRHLQVPGAAGALLVGSVVVAIARSFFYTREMAKA
jgi:O-antigen/teichoic acid export membrane protein